MDSTTERNEFEFTGLCETRDLKYVTINGQNGYSFTPCPYPDMCKDMSHPHLVVNVLDRVPSSPGIYCSEKTPYACIIMDPNRGYVMFTTFRDETLIVWDVITIKELRDLYHNEESNALSVTTTVQYSGARLIDSSDVSDYPDCKIGSERSTNLVFDYDTGCLRLTGVSHREFPSSIAWCLDWMEGDFLRVMYQ